MVGIIGVLFIVNVIPAFLISRDADKRNMNGGGWFLIILFFSLIGMILYIIVRKPLAERSIKSTHYDLDYKICPECAEHIREEAKVCRFCSYRYILEENTMASVIKELQFPLDVKIIEDNAPLYSEDNNKSKIIKKFQKGENIVALSQLGEFNEWLKVKSQNEEGYILKYDVDLQIIS